MKWYVRLAVYIGMITLVLGAGVVTTQLLGLERHVVQSGSMEPLMPVGTRIVIQKGNDDLRPNDIITFRDPEDETGGLVTHIFGGYTADGALMTRGLANEEPDNYTPAPTKADVVGKVVYHTPFFTKAFWQSSRGKGVVMLFGSGLLFLALSWTLGRKQAARKYGALPVVTTASQPI